MARLSSSNHQLSYPLRSPQRRNGKRIGTIRSILVVSVVALLLSLSALVRVGMVVEHTTSKTNAMPSTFSSTTSMRRKAPPLLDDKNNNTPAQGRTKFATTDKDAEAEQSDKKHNDGGNVRGESVKSWEPEDTKYLRVPHRIHLDKLLGPGSKVERCTTTWGPCHLASSDTTARKTILRPLKYLYYNALKRDRFVCGTAVPADDFLVWPPVDNLDASTGCTDKDRPTLFPVTPDLNGTGLPPVQLRFGPEYGTPPVTTWDSCPVPCISAGSNGVVARRHVAAADGTEYSLSFSMEGPMYYPDLNQLPFAWRKQRFYSTTSFDSEVPLPYYSEAEYNIQNPAVNFETAIPGAVFLARNCKSKNDRESLIQALMDAPAGLRIDSLSGCLHNADPPPGVDLHGPKDDILRHYLFYLAFENQNFPDYITEKLWGPLQAGVVPVYYGAPNARLHLPDRSVIFASEFADAAALADYLQTVAHNRTLYESYHVWRTQPLPPSFRALYDMTRIHSTCRTCLWAYARMYGWGWDRERQQVRPLRMGSRRACLNPRKDGTLNGPLVEGWKWAASVEDSTVVDTTKQVDVVWNGADGGGEDPMCELNHNNREITLDHGTIRRRVYDQDGVTDFVIDRVPSSSNGDGAVHATNALENPLVLQLTLHALPPVTISSSVGMKRRGLWSFQNKESRITMLVSPTSTIVKPTQENDVEIVISSLPVRIRIILEDVDTVHEEADQEENPFGRLMADDFFRPLQRFVQVE